jgi:hypothetical protein
MKSQNSTINGKPCVAYATSFTYAETEEAIRQANVTDSDETYRKVIVRLLGEPQFWSPQQISTVLTVERDIYPFKTVGEVFRLELDVFTERLVLDDEAQALADAKNLTPIEAQSLEAISHARPEDFWVRYIAEEVGISASEAENILHRLQGEDDSTALITSDYAVKVSNYYVTQLGDEALAEGK